MVHVPSKKQTPKTNGKPAPKADTPAIKSVAVTDTELKDIANAMGEVNAELSPFVDAIVAKSDEVEAAPMRVLAILQQKLCGLDDNGNPTVKLSEFFPRPVKNAEAEKGSNAKHKQFFKAMKPDGKGGMTEKTCDYFTESYLELDSGKAQAFILKQCEYMIGKGIKKTGIDQAKAIEPYKSMQADKIGNLASKTAKHFTKGRSMLRQAVGVWYVMDDISEHAERVTLDYDNSTDLDTILQSPYPMNLSDPKRLRLYRPMSVREIAKLDVAKAVKEAGPDGNLYDALVKQLSRGTVEGETETVQFKTETEMWRGSLAFSHWFDPDSEDGAKHISDLLLSLSKKGAGEARLKWGAFMRAARATWTAELQAAYEVDVAKQLKAEAERAKAEAA